MFDAMIWIGTVVTLAGLAGLVWCILRVARAKRAGLREEDLRAVMQSTMPLNTGALFLSVMGLMLVVIGIMLG
ncbi:hypothetical protein [Pukyongiella litopenaei]|uniref:Uncharacterized protein n=1 Tax=Pukyongiella litopenaei TaxID=2605946 RepID=A0A2S0MKD0_9RHOB|nr:hypothetical protein [Pukyongiella litopenaei]AVO36287.1 hypothetical protein C6Y53_00220 [Pukyongiella litopenaei]